MQLRPAVSTILCVLLISITLNSQLVLSETTQFHNLTSIESEIASNINGTNAYNYALELERIGLNHTLSDYSFRSSGSSGANATAKWIEEQFQNFGLDTQMESFEFTTWDLLAQPKLILDEDGNPNTTDDQVDLQSFQAEHYSMPTPNGSVFGELVTLPLPDSSNRDLLATKLYDAGAWNKVNTTGKILLIGREFRWINNLHLIFKNKLEAEPPAAVIFTWVYDWMAWAPPSFNSMGGRPVSSFGPYFWNFRIPVGWVSYADGLRIRQEIGQHNTSAWVSIRSSIGTGPHLNVVGKLTGSRNPEKIIIVSGHYDTVTTPGFCDNGAGTAGVMELARAFSEGNRTDRYKPEVSIIFIAFAGEELGSVGAVDYIRRHQDELANTVAVINLDCIGGEHLELSETFTDDKGLDLQGIVTTTAYDFGLTVNVAAAGGSDQEAFRNPVQTDADYSFFWGSNSGVRNVTRVKGSIMISSYPLFISDIWQTGIPGWIHTSYDNSTSSTTLDWVNVTRLENQIRVTGISVMRVSAITTSSLPLPIYGAAAATIIVVAIAAYFERAKLRPFARTIRHELSSHIGPREVVYVVVLTSILLFTSFAMQMRLVRIEIVYEGYPVGVTMQYFGTPFDMLGIPQLTEAQLVESPESSLPAFTTSPTEGIQILWTGFILDLALFAFIAFAVVYSVAKIRYRVEYRRLRS